MGSAPPKIEKEPSTISNPPPFYFFISNMVRQEMGLTIHNLIHFQNPTGIHALSIIVFTLGTMLILAAFGENLQASVRPRI